MTSKFFSNSLRICRDQLIAMANGTTFMTARDANGHLLLDFNHDGEIDETMDGGWAFHEHNGIGNNGLARGPPFTNFWFDDNYLARFMTLKYHLAPPNGLSDYGDFTRWKVLGGDNSGWVPYRQQYVDTLCLDALFYLTANDVDGAIKAWHNVLAIARPRWDHERQEYSYPGLVEAYHVALAKIVAEELHQRGVEDALQHAVALRSLLLARQVLRQEADGRVVRLGWTSSLVEPSSLMNIESTALGALALGHGADLTFECGADALEPDPALSFYYRPYFALSAVQGLSRPGPVVPSFNLIPPSQFISVSVIVRSPTGGGVTVAVLSVDGDVIHVEGISNDALFWKQADGRWAEWRTQTFESSHYAEVRVAVEWNGGGSVDFAVLRINCSH
jgi:hypothetical protein